MNEHSPASLLQQLVGVECWAAQLVNGEELQLEFGAEVPSPTRRHPRLTVGEWTLIVASPAWDVDGVPWKQFAQDDDELTSTLRRLENRVTAANLDVMTSSLELRFASFASLRIRAQREDSRGPDWEFFLPGARVIVAGPGKRWTLQSAYE